MAADFVSSPSGLAQSFTAATIVWNPRKSWFRRSTGGGRTVLARERRCPVVDAVPVAADDRHLLRLRFGHPARVEVENRIDLVCRLALGVDLREGGADAAPGDGRLALPRSRNTLDRRAGVAAGACHLLDGPVLAAGHGPEPAGAEEGHDVLEPVADPPRTVGYPAWRRDCSSLMILPDRLRHLRRNCSDQASHASDSKTGLPPTRTCARAKSEVIVAAEGLEDEPDPRSSRR